MSARSSDHELAVELAREAGAMLLALRTVFGADRPDELRVEGDRRAHRLIVEALGRERPADAVLSEEGEDDHGRLTA